MYAECMLQQRQTKILYRNWNRKDGYGLNVALAATAVTYFGFFFLMDYSWDKIRNWRIVEESKAERHKNAGNHTHNPKLSGNNNNAQETVEKVRQSKCYLSK